MPTASKTAKRPHFTGLNIGLVIFVIILVYLIINVVIALGKTSVAIVEVQKGQIVDNGYYTGLILREESVVNAYRSGHINYYVRNGGKVAKDGRVYTLSDKTSDAAAGQEDTDLLTADDYQALKGTISIYTGNYSDSRFSDLYAFGNDLLNQLNERISYHNIERLSTVSDARDDVISGESGIVCLSYDGLEGLTRDTLSPAQFNGTNEDRTQLVSNQWINAGSPAYKLVTSDQWSIVIRLGANEMKALSTKKYILVRFLKDDVQVYANVECYRSGSENYACLTMSKYMVRYIADRYIDIELIENSAQGLKIPTSAVTTKDFFKIPVDFLVTDKTTDEEGFYTIVQNGDAPEARFFKATIYHNDGQYCYVDMNTFKVGDKVGKINASDTFTIGITGQLTGVYNVNKGYSVFRLIQVLYSNDDYCIIQSNTAYGVSLYDRIILNSSSVAEDQLIY